MLDPRAVSVAVGGTEFLTKRVANSPTKWKPVDIAEREPNEGNGGAHRNANNEPDHEPEYFTN